MILDASAVLAMLLEEPGSRIVEDAIDQGAILSTVNLAEVVGRLVRDGIDPDEAEQALADLPVTFVPLAPATALAAGALLVHTRPHGLSLGDRVCLALAREQNLPAVTADRAWIAPAAALGVTLRLIR